MWVLHFIKTFFSESVLLSIQDMMAFIYTENLITSNVIYLTKWKLWAKLHISIWTKFIQMINCYEQLSALNKSQN